MPSSPDEILAALERQGHNGAHAPTPRQVASVAQELGVDPRTVWLAVAGPAAHREPVGPLPPLPTDPATDDAAARIADALRIDPGAARRAARTPED